MCSHEWLSSSCVHTAQKGKKGTGGGQEKACCSGVYICTCYWLQHASVIEWERACPPCVLVCLFVYLSTKCRDTGYDQCCMFSTLLLQCNTCQADWWWKVCGAPAGCLYAELMPSACLDTEILGLLFLGVVSAG